MLEAKAKDQGHKRKCSPKKKSSKNFFRRSPKKRSSKIFFRRFPVTNVFQNFFQAIYKISAIQEKVLCLSRGQGNFQGLEAQRWSRGHKARDQGHKKKSEAKAKDSLSEDRTSRGQGQECLRPRPTTKDTATSVL